MDTEQAIREFWDGNVATYHGTSGPFDAVTQCYLLWSLPDLGRTQTVPNFVITAG